MLGEEGLRTSPSGIASIEAGCGGSGLRPQPQKQKQADRCELNQLSKLPVRAAPFHTHYTVCKLLRRPGGKVTDPPGSREGLACLLPAAEFLAGLRCGYG